MEDLENIKLKRAPARLLEAHVDFESAKALSKSGIDSRSLYHSQQCAEKALKACLSKTNVGEIKSHTVVQYFQSEIMPLLTGELKEKFKDLHNLIWVEERWMDTRYEEFRAGKIKVPSMQFSADDAETGIKTAEKALLDCTNVVEFLFKKEIPKNTEGLKTLLNA
ncbi:HEPN domain-containing protein [archaeon]|nr:HEPN domain-containing protein [Nanoarchaeota archaeon]MBU4300907.1 HEPN domain-containing protein [Nanoarchaeota archaeon]MBU4451749.1 HEPN domain-containing protein [Nanoarchaeota archaeon]MCG2723254.1 HEPN domain-containing protein [archaeon]